MKSLASSKKSKYSSKLKLRTTIKKPKENSVFSSASKKSLRKKKIISKNLTESKIPLTEREKNIQFLTDILSDREESVFQNEDKKSNFEKNEEGNNSEIEIEIENEEDISMEKKHFIRPTKSSQKRLELAMKKKKMESVSGSKRRIYQMDQDFYSKYEVLSIYDNVIKDLKMPKVAYGFRPRKKSQGI